MNDNNRYQDDFQTPTRVPVSQENANQSTYNDTYYEQSYSTNKYNEYEEPKKSFPWKIVIIVILALLFIFLFWYFLLGGGSNSGGNSKYEKLTADLCEKALEYERNNEGIIDRKTQGSTAYIRIQTLVDNYLWDSKAIKDPRYKKSIFSKSEYKEYISFDSYLRLSVASNGEPYCEGFVDTSDDHNKPILSLKGTTPITIAKGTNFEDPGARATDDVDGDITDKIVRSGNVDISKVGEYVITYTVSDTSGNTSTVKRTIIVEEYADLEITLGSHFDTITPVIELKGNNPYCIEFGNKYKEPGAIATDNVDGNITNKIIVDSSQVTGNRLGNFRVTYTVSDTFGHKAIAYRSVMVKEKCATTETVVAPVNNRPVISVIGKSAITIPLGEAYNDLGATAWDKEDGDITHLVRTTNNVNTNIAQVYTVIYRVTDSGGLTATAKRTVTVYDPNANSNVATFVGGCPQNIRIPLGNEQVVPTPTAKDSRGADVPVRTVLKDSSGAVVGKINYYRVNVYTTEYFAKPANGVEQQCIRTVTIYDDVKPTITAPDPMFLPVRSENCNITEQDLVSAGLIVSDAPNEVKPVVTISGGENKMCSVNTNGFEVTITAKDASGNTTVKKIKVYVVDGEGGDATGVLIGNCGTNKETLMYVGDKLNLISHVYPINAKDKTVGWSSMSPEYATVTDTGLITALAPGSTDVTVTTAVGGHKATCKIIVKERTQVVSVTGVSIAGCESGTLNLQVGASKTLSATILPNNASNKAVNWTSSNAPVATITGAGVVKAIAVGESIIKVSTSDGNKTKDCKVVVSANAPATDTTAPTDIVVYHNNANLEDPYNVSGKWMGGNLGKEVKISVSAKDPESPVTKFEMYDSSGKVLQTIGAETLVSKCNNPNEPLPKGIKCLGSETIYRAIFTIKEDRVENLTFAAINSVNLKSSKTKPVIVKLDNTGPTTTFKSWIEDPNKWVSQPSVKVIYDSKDSGIGVEKYEYTHDDVKAKAATDIKIAGTTKEVEMTFLESNLNKFVYVRAVDSLGNLGAWTAKPSYLNMDTVPPLPPGLRVESNSTTNVKVYFTFTDGTSPKMSGFGKYEYFTNNNAGITKTDESTPVSFTSQGSYTMRAWSYDKAGNKSLNFGETKFTVTSGGTGGPTTPTPTPTPTDPTLSATCPTVNVGNTGTVSVTQTGFKTVTYTGYSIDDHYIASIVKPADKSLSTTVTGVKTGTTKVTITVKGIPNGGTTEVSKYTTCIVTVTQPTPVTVSRYRYGMTNNYTGSNSYSDWIYTSQATAKAACEATPKAKERVASGTCGYLVSSTTKYRYIFTNSDGTKKYSGYSYATSNDATNACKAANPIAFSNPSLCTTSSNTTNRYAYVYTDTFTKAKQTSGYSYPTSSIAMDSCRGKITQVPTVTCWGDRNPKTVNQ